MSKILKPGDVEVTLRYNVHTKEIGFLVSSPIPFTDIVKIFCNAQLALVQQAEAQGLLQKPSNNPAGKPPAGNGGLIHGA